MQSECKSVIQGDEPCFQHCAKADYTYTKGNLSQKLSLAPDMNLEHNSMFSMRLAKGKVWGAQTDLASSVVTAASPQEAATNQFF